MFTIDTIKYVLKQSYERSLGFLTSRDWITAVAIYWVFLSIFSFKGYKRKAFYLATLMSYLFLMYMFTVFERAGRDEFIMRLKPFWSYEQIMQGSRIFLLQVVLNMLMFVPIGILLGLMEVGFSRMIISAALLSYSVEALQLILKRGYFELFDDPFHNIIGALIGYGLTLIIVKLIRKIKSIYFTETIDE